MATGETEIPVKVMNKKSWLTAEQRKTLSGFVAGSIAACGAVTFTNPFEVVKTRLQLQGELAKAATDAAGKPMPRAYKNVFQAFWVISQNEGIRALQKGLGAGYIYQVFLNGTRIGCYGPIKTSLNEAAGKRESMPLNVVAGLICGMLGAAAGSPFYLVKTRMQSYSTFAAVGHQHCYPTFMHGLASVYREHGFKGLYRGMDAAMARAGTGSAVQFASYDKCKELIMNNFGGDFGPANFRTHLLASMVTGFLVCTAMNPFDVISTRMYNQKMSKGKGGALYRNPLECLVRTVSTEGVSSLYKGFFAHYLRIGPHTILMFVFLEQIKNRMAKYL